MLHMWLGKVVAQGCVRITVMFEMRHCMGPFQKNHASVYLHNYHHKEGCVLVFCVCLFVC